MKVNFKDWKSVVTAVTAALVTWSALKFAADAGSIVAVITAFAAGTVQSTPKI
jgi:hypothetical protein